MKKQRVSLSDAKTAILAMHAIANDFNNEIVNLLKISNPDNEMYKKLSEIQNSIGKRFNELKNDFQAKDYNCIPKS